MSSTSISAAPSAIDWRWLSSRRFDLSFLIGIPMVSLTVFTVLMAKPELFLPILIIDLWLLGYHHVISTYTRICFDRKSLEQHGILLWGLLPAVVIGTFSVAWFVGIWVIVSIYFYWQWFHYVRQSWGISRAYRGRQGDALYEDGWLDQAIFWAVPIAGVLHRSYQDPGKFIGMDLRVIPVAGWLASAAIAVATILFAYWVFRRVQAARQGRLNAAQTLYMCSHFYVFSMAYLFIPDLTLGWLFINIWHNAQYILFVWMYNTKRFKGGIDPKARFLSYISQPQRLALYLFVCIAITGVLYGVIFKVLEAYVLQGVMGTVLLYQVVNFHHYVVDSRIWKVRSGEVKQTLDMPH
jgi:hypothetical protein